MTDIQSFHLGVVYVNFVASYVLWVHLLFSKIDLPLRFAASIAFVASIINFIIVVTL
jgi:hypothetical protein